jgi:GNAT superfamily N-acetyltransferase
MPQRPTAGDPIVARAIDDVLAEWTAYQEGLPGVEVHCDRDIHWAVQQGSAWSNCGSRIRFTENEAGRRLDQILQRYRKNGRGAGFWVSPMTEPANFEEYLRKRGLRCRRYFPEMCADLESLPRALEAKLEVAFEVAEDYSIFEKHPHPGMGPITTAIRRFRLDGQRMRAERKPRRSWEIMAVAGGKPVGICTVFAGDKNVAGIFDVAVQESARNRGVGTALMAHACRFARKKVCKQAVLISSGMGYGVYVRVGFREAARIGYWYTAKP